MTWTPAAVRRLFWAGFVVLAAVFAWRGGLAPLLALLAYGAVAGVPLRRWERRRDVDASEELAPPAQPHPRLPRYDARVARVRHDGQQVGWLLAFASWHARVDGHLWWKRTAPSEHALEGWVQLLEVPDDQEFVDFFIVDPAELEAELDDWDAGRLRWRGAVHELAWLDATASSEAALRVFDWVSTDRALPGAPSRSRVLTTRSLRAVLAEVVDALRPELDAVGVAVDVEVRRSLLHPDVWRVRLQVVPDDGADAGAGAVEHVVSEAAAPASLLRPATASLPQAVLAVRAELRQHAAGLRPPFPDTTPDGSTRQ